jgi:hypothetical protein
VDVLGRDEGHVLRVSTVNATNESFAFSLSCILLGRVFENNPVWDIRSDWEGVGEGSAHRSRKSGFASPIRSFAPFHVEPLRAFIPVTIIRVLKEK